MRIGATRIGALYNTQEIRRKSFEPSNSLIFNKLIAFESCWHELCRKAHRAG